jgi:hypothetical protein
MSRSPGHVPDNEAGDRELLRRLANRSKSMPGAKQSGPTGASPGGSAKHSGVGAPGSKRTEIDANVGDVSVWTFLLAAAAVLTVLVWGFGRVKGWW